MARDLGERWRVVDAGRDEARAVTAPVRFLNADLVQARTFAPTKLRQGYVVKDVDEMVRRVSASMQRLDEYLRILLT